MLSSDAAKLIPNNSLDYVYVDARHDYCGVTDDLLNYWPKVRPGGIFAGHDYVAAKDSQKKSTGQDWSLCADGSRRHGAVKEAVLDFANERHLQIVVVYKEQVMNPSWMIRKPVDLSDI